MTTLIAEDLSPYSRPITRPLVNVDTETLYADWRRAYRHAKRAERKGHLDNATRLRQQCRTIKAELEARRDPRLLEWTGAK